MIPKLRRRILLIAMASLIGTLTLLCLVINLGYYQLATKRADTAIQLLYRYNGEFPQPDTTADPAAHAGFQITEETPFETRYFIVHLTSQREVADVDIEHIAALDRQMVVDLVADIVDASQTSGYSGYYRYLVFSEDSGGSTIIVLDCFLQLQAVNNVLHLTFLASLACVALVLLLLVPLSKRAARPFVENLERQRQFVTDASHELKTPLAIISANTGLLEATMGENRWLVSTQDQITRLDRLIRRLIELARTEETIQEAEAVLCAFSPVVERAMEDFRPLAEAAGKRLEDRVEPDINLRGVPDNLTRLCTLLLDNAVKYCDDGGTIRVVLSQRGRWAEFTVSNPCIGLDPAQIPRLFDRFYRADASRDRSTGGYGIGLSTAKAIVSRHRGKLTARSSAGTVTFTALIPLAPRGKSGD